MSVSPIYTREGETSPVSPFLETLASMVEQWGWWNTIILLGVALLFLTILRLSNGVVDILLELLRGYFIPPKEEPALEPAFMMSINSDSAVTVQTSAPYLGTRQRTQAHGNGGKGASGSSKS